MTTFCVEGGYVKSLHDGDVHYVGADRLASLYQLEPGEWRVHDLRDLSCGHLRHLGPSRDGHYGRPS